ncbi:MAG: hypothetical protein SWK90_05395 [Chloroflexota bacterium]|nr:hypothetical protein [Chloroflexota bacterium]
MSEERVKIQVRAMNSADWHALYEIWAEPGVYRDTLKIPFQSEDEVRKKAENPPEGVYRLVAEALPRDSARGVDSQMVGISSLHRGRNPRLHHVAGCGMSVRLRRRDGY